MSAKAGTLRGLHFQHQPHAEMKLVSCLRGRVYDVAFDPTLAIAWPLPVGERSARDQALPQLAKVIA